MRDLGRLEAAIMDVVWDAADALAVREVRDLLTDHDLAYTTVSTVLDNLHRKGLVTRVQLGRAWYYTPAADRDSYAAGLMRDALSAGGDARSTFLSFVSQISADESAVLRGLLRDRDAGNAT